MVDFLSLPAEARNMIYGLALPEDKYFSRHSTPTAPYYQTPALLLVSKQVHSDVKAMFYSRNNFYLSSPIHVKCVPFPMGQFITSPIMNYIKFLRMRVTVRGNKTNGCHCGGGCLVALDVIIEDGVAKVDRKLYLGEDEETCDAHDILKDTYNRKHSLWMRCEKVVVRDEIIKFLDGCVPSS